MREQVSDRPAWTPRVSRQLLKALNSNSFIVNRILMLQIKEQIQILNGNNFFIIILTLDMKTYLNSDWQRAV